MSDPKIETVKRIYEAFGRQDVPAILNELAEELDWATESTGGAPWNGPRHTKDDVVRFFQQIAGAVDATEFTPLAFGVNDSEVFTVVRFGVRAKASGRAGTMNLHHWFRFRDGKVCGYRGSEDTRLTAELLAG